MLISRITIEYINIQGESPLHWSIVEKLRLGNIWSFDTLLKSMGLKYFQDGATIRSTRNRYQLSYVKWHYICLLNFWIKRGILGSICVWLTIPKASCFWDIQFFPSKIIFVYTTYYDVSSYVFILNVITKYNFTYKPPLTNEANCGRSFQRNGKQW